MVTPAVVEQRIANGRAYLEALANPRWGTWVEGYHEYRQRHLEIPEALTLVHPEWRSDSTNQAIQGPRNFSVAEFGRSEACEAARIWGYACSLGSDDAIQADHVFPYSLGGPTVVQNRLLLCRTHNAGKAGDIHLFPWEEGVPAWLEPLLERIRIHLTS